MRRGISKRLAAERRGGDAAPVRHRAFATGGEEAEAAGRREIAARIAAGSAPRDHAVLVRSNAEADPILRSLNLAGIPWRFSGASGLYARPEVRLLMAFLRAVADLGSSVDVYVLDAVEVSTSRADLTAIGDAAPPGQRRLALSTSSPAYRLRRLRPEEPPARRFVFPDAAPP